MSNDNNYFFFVVLVILAILLFGCGQAQPQETPARPDPQTVTNTIIHPAYYGNGVYYFACDGACFGRSLSRFIAEHPGLELTATASHFMTTAVFIGAPIHNDGYYAAFRVR